MVVYEGVEINEVNLREHREAIHSVLSVSDRVSKYHLHLAETQSQAEEWNA